MRVIKKIFGKFRYMLASMRNPIKLAREMGVTVGENCSFVSMPNFGSEPYLIEIGNHVRIASGVFFSHTTAPLGYFETMKNTKKC